MAPPAPEPVLAGLDFLPQARIIFRVAACGRPSTEGGHLSGAYGQRVTLSSGRFAMIDDGMGFQLVPWRPALEQQLGRQVGGVVTPDSNVDWSFGRKRGLGI